MKAIVKESGQEIEVLSVFARNTEYATHYDITDISFVEKPDTESSIDWEDRRFELVKAAMQGLLSTCSPGLLYKNFLAALSIDYANTVLAEYMKGGEE